MDQQTEISSRYTVVIAGLVEFLAPLCFICTLKTPTKLILADRVSIHIRVRVRVRIITDKLCRCSECINKTEGIRNSTLLIFMTKQHLLKHT